MQIIRTVQLWLFCFIFILFSNSYAADKIALALYEIPPLMSQSLKDGGVKLAIVKAACKNVGCPGL